jgi:glycine/D-amino acid oxidase-like deaminating enzyme
MTLRVTVVGAGIVGAAAADRLARAGVAVTLVDAGLPGGGTSATSLGWLNANRQPQPYFEFRVAAMRAWAELAAEFGRPPWYQPSGHVEWVVEADEQAELDQHVQFLRGLDYDAAIVTRSQAGALEPRLRIPAEAMIAHYPGEGWVDGAGAAAALAARAGAHGATVIANDPVVAIDARAGRITAARMASGVVSTCDVLLCCAGWRSGQVTRFVGGDLPLVHADAPGSEAPAVVAATAPTPARPTGVVHSPRLCLRPTVDGGVFLEAGDIDATIDAATTDSELDQAAAALVERSTEVIPDLDGTPVRWARRCVRPLPDDGFPIVGWHPAADGLYVAVTHSGITLAPHLASLIADDLLRGGARALGPYRPDRFR